VTPADIDLPVNDGTLPWDHPATVAWAERVDEIEPTPPEVDDPTQDLPAE